MAASLPEVPPQLARLLYRSCLRVSKNGRHPEVFSNLGAEVYNIQVRSKNDHPTLAMPSSPAHVRQRLKTWFQDPSLDKLKSSSPLQALPQILQHADALKLQAGLPRSLRILENQNIGALTGEYLQFTLTETIQIDAMLALTAEKEESTHFILRQGADINTGIAMKLLSHHKSRDQNLSVACLAGSRVRLDSIGIADGDGFSVVKRYKLLRDTASPSSLSKNRHARQYILDMLYCVLPNQDTNLSETLTYFGMPPIDPEDFSFWALRYILPIEDVASRWKWSHESVTTNQRLNFVMEEIESILEEMDSYEEGTSVSSQ